MKNSFLASVVPVQRCVQELPVRTVHGSGRCSRGTWTWLRVMAPVRCQKRSFESCIWQFAHITHKAISLDCFFAWSKTKLDTTIFIMWKPWECFIIRYNVPFFKWHNGGWSELRWSEHYMLLTCWICRRMNLLQKRPFFVECQGSHSSKSHLGDCEVYW